jgi:hypothetical protein
MTAAFAGSDSFERASATRTPFSQKVIEISEASTRRTNPNEAILGPGAATVTGIDSHEVSRFRIFVVDTDQNLVASKVLRENFALLLDINPNDPAYYLDRDRSIDLLRQHTKLIGRDPIIIVQDMHPVRQSGGGAHGFRVHLGLLHKERDVLQALQMFARFMRKNSAAKNLDMEAREKLLREGFAGAIEIIGGHPKKTPPKS